MQTTGRQRMAGCSSVSLESHEFQLPTGMVHIVGELLELLHHQVVDDSTL